MELTQDEIDALGSHYTAADMKRRLAAYRKANNSKVAEPSVQKFYEEQGISNYQISIDKNTEEALDSCKIYIERVSY